MKKADKDTLMALKSFFETPNNESFDDYIYDVCEDTHLITNDYYRIPLDEYGIECQGEFLCTLDIFLREFTKIVFERVRQSIDSFVGRELYMKELTKGYASAKENK